MSLLQFSFYNLAPVSLVSDQCWPVLSQWSVVSYCNMTKKCAAMTVVPSNTRAWTFFWLVCGKFYITILIKLYKLFSINQWCHRLYLNFYDIKKNNFLKRCLVSEWGKTWKTLYKECDLDIKRFRQKLWCDNTIRDIKST